MDLHVSYESGSDITVNLNMLSSMHSEIQGFPDCRRSWKKERAVVKASEVADEQMVNWKAGKISKSDFILPAPDLAEQLFGHQPGGHSRQQFPQSHKQKVQARYQSPSIQMRGWVGEQGGIDWPTVAWWSSSVKHLTWQIFSPCVHHLIFNI